MSGETYDNHIAFISNEPLSEKQSEKVWELIRQLGEILTGPADQIPVVPSRVKNCPPSKLCRFVSRCFRSRRLHDLIYGLESNIPLCCVLHYTFGSTDGLSKDFSFRESFNPCLFHRHVKPAAELRFYKTVIKDGLGERDGYDLEAWGIKD
jgi:hypothetical protein